MATFTCPRCFFSGSADPALRFCPRCGLADVQQVAAVDGAPIELTVGNRAIRVLDRLAIGSISTIYRCRFTSGKTEREGVFKIARDARTNDLLANEADILRRLHNADSDRRFAGFLPRIEESFVHGDDARLANVLGFHQDIRSIDELYTLEEVLAHHRGGLDSRDMAWIWRRLLNVLGFVHSQQIVHGAVLPMHVLIEPAEHKLVLIDFCGAVRDAAKNRLPLAIIARGYDRWYPPEVRSKQPPTAALDVSMAARCMIKLTGGDASRAEFSPTMEPALAAYFRRCLSGVNVEAWRLLDDFDRLIETLWGPRKFRVLTMPAKRSVN